MTAKRFRSGLAKNEEFSDEIIDELTGKHYFDSTKDDYVFSEEIVDLLNKIWEQTQRFERYNKDLMEENEQLKYKINDLLYQIEYVGKNNKSCDGCECFLEDIEYCWMWDMNVKKEDIVVACDQRKVKNTK